MVFLQISLSVHNFLGYWGWVIPTKFDLDDMSKMEALNG